PVDDDGVARQPYRRPGAADNERDNQDEREPVGPPPRTNEVQRPSPSSLSNRSAAFSTVRRPRRSSCPRAYSSAVAKMTTMSPSEIHLGNSKSMYCSVCRYSTSSLTATHAMMMNAASTSGG